MSVEMQGVILLIVYIVVLILQMVYLGLTVAKKVKLWPMYIITGVCSIAAFLMMYFFDNVTGEGIIKGLTYFKHEIYSMFAGMIYAVMAAITGAYNIIRFAYERRIM